MTELDDLMVSIDETARMVIANRATSRHRPPSELIGSEEIMKKFGPKQLGAAIEALGMTSNGAARLI
jgi:hypothetical protein